MVLTEKERCVTPVRDDFRIVRFSLIVNSTLYSCFLYTLNRPTFLRNVRTLYHTCSCSLYITTKVKSKRLLVIHGRSHFLVKLVKVRNTIKLKVLLGLLHVSENGRGTPNLITSLVGSNVSTIDHSNPTF